jgi:hypothetical protein
VNVCYWVLHGHRNERRVQPRPRCEVCGYENDFFRVFDIWSSDGEQVTVIRVCPVCDKELGLSNLPSRGTLAFES